MMTIDGQHVGFPSYLKGSITYDADLPVPRWDVGSAMTEREACLLEVSSK